MEEPQTSARKLWSQPWGSRALLSLVCFSILRNHQWQMPKGPQGQRTTEGVGRRCHPEPEGLGAHLSFPELPLHDTAIARQEIVPGLAEGAARHNFQERQSWGYWWVSDAVSGLGRRTEESTGLQPHWGGWCEPRARGGSAKVFMTPAAWSTPAKGRTADKQQVFRARGTESTGVTQM